MFNSRTLMAVAIVLLPVVALAEQPTNSTADKGGEERKKSLVQNAEHAARLVSRYLEETDKEYKESAVRRERLREQLLQLDKGRNVLRGDEARKKHEEATRAIAREIQAANGDLVDRQLRFARNYLAEDKALSVTVLFPTNSIAFVYVPPGESKERTKEQTATDRLPVMYYALQATNETYRTMLVRRDGLRKQRDTLKEGLELSKADENKTTISGALQAVEAELGVIDTGIRRRQDDFIRQCAATSIYHLNDGYFMTEALLEKYLPQKDAKKDNAGK